MVHEEPTYACLTLLMAVCVVESAWSRLHVDLGGGVHVMCDIDQPPCLTVAWQARPQK